MAGYKNPVITLRFDDLGDGCHVVIRNPKLMPGGQLRAMASGRSDADREKFKAALAAAEAGQEPPDDVLTDADEDRIFGMIAGLVVGWRVWDPTAPVDVDDDGNIIEGDSEPARLPLPATPETVKLLPQAILTRIMNEVSTVNPQVPPAPPEDGTSSPS